MSKATVHVQIDANVIRQLGDQLVTDAEQALLELVKNCWDADASTASIVVDTNCLDEIAGQGKISIRDDGTGMDWKTIESGWLTISLSPKRAMKAEGRTTTEYERTPLGDKGLGRLGTMKLGNVVQITTHSDKNSHGWFVSLTWSDFASGQLLSEVKVIRRQVPATGTRGTCVEVLGLTDPSYWRGESRLADLEVKLSTLISPFEEFSTFKVQIVVDEKPILLEKVSRQLRHAATAQFMCDWNGSELSCTARCKLSMFAAGIEADRFEELARQDNGAALYRFLARRDGAKDFNLKRGPKAWYIELSKSWALGDIVGKRSGDKPPDDPGPFVSELDAFSLADSNAQHEEINLQLPEFRKLIKRLAGVRIYRNGFAIRMEEDWLQLGRTQTSGASWYGLKPGNTIGFVALTAAENPTVQEKSDREGFIDSPSVRGFRDLMDKFADFANEGLTFLRREYVEFRRERTAEQSKLPAAWKPDDAVSRLRELSTTAKRARQAIQAADKTQRDSLDRTKTHLSRALEQDLPKRAKAQLEEAQELVAELASELQTRRQELDTLIGTLTDEQRLGEAILERFEQMSIQMDEVYATVAIGIVAQALAHDIHSIIDDLLTRTQRVSKKVRDLGDASVGGYLEAVRTTSNLIRKQLTFLDPMLRSARELRQVFSVSEFASEFVELRRERLSRFDIAVESNVIEDFKITFNRGRLMQILDNLVRNSEYWLRQHALTHENETLSITIEIRSPFITVWDSGPGVGKAVENTLFEMFVSDKPKGEATGLGLFIVRQLLQQENCEISLGSKRNRRGRRYQFTMDMTEAMPDE
jgi:signal transduction histidine kinase